MADINARIVEHELKQFGYVVTAYMPNAFGHAMGGSLGATAKIITKVIAEGLAHGVFTSKDLREANLEIARRAQRDIVQGWRSRLPLKSPPYRRGSDPNKDRLSGKLGETLASESMVQGTTDRGISFLNTSVLAEEARHWYRVNYGAYGHNVAAIRRPKMYPVTVDGHTLFTLQDENQPAPNSFLPVRFSFQHNEFIPHQGPADVEGGGHRAALFTDIGFRSLGENFGPVYRKMLFTKFSRGGMTERFSAKNASVQAVIKAH